MFKILKFIWHIPRNIAVGFIWLWQHTLSLDHGPLSHHFAPHCKYTPTCSQYGKLAFQKYGFLKGFYLTTWRILRCNPWSRGGKDLP